MSMESIHGPGVTPPTMPSLRPNPAPDQDAHGAAANRPAAVPQPGGQPAPVPGRDRMGAESLTPAPAGVDPDIWSVLTAEEQEFFAVARQMGPVTYGRQHEAANETSLPRGRRLDVRV